ncbi:MAG: aminotransferase class I/II-fold pyridoxal phosphate-dependent enzyme [Xanthomonadales bacterium]|nr:aminotransferase class I/II-fold pyridoxal phosphate-dependent enzyme [Xanthomonadales bacterium]
MPLHPWSDARLPPAIAALRAYDPGHDLVAFRVRFGDRLIEVGSNENLLGPAPAALAALADPRQAAWRYPDPRGGALRAALARLHGLEPDGIVLGNGSHEILMRIALAFAPAGAPVVFSRYGFAVFAIATAAAGARAVAVPALPADHPQMPLGHDLEKLAGACSADTRVLYLANPNNPTGTWFEPDALARLLDEVPSTTLVVVDEAYQEYQPEAAARSALRLLARHRNLLVTRTFSKAYGLAGLRVGWAAGDAAVIAVLDRVRESFNVNGLAQAAATAALGDAGHVAAECAAAAAARSRLAGVLAGLGVASLPSRCNFLLADFGSAGRAASVEQALGSTGVVVRPMAGYGLGERLRISLAPPAREAALAAALAEAVATPG